MATSAPNLLGAREQMAFTLGLHTVLFCGGVVLPGNDPDRQLPWLKAQQRRRDRVPYLLPKP